MFELLLEVSNFSTFYTIYISLLLAMVLVYTIPWDSTNSRLHAHISMKDEFELYVSSKLNMNTNIINWIVTWIHNKIKKYIYTDLDTEDSLFLLTH
jgi:hypothetical protein